MYTLSGKIVAITGAGNGIGRALALECAKRGAQLALSDIREEPLQETARLIADLGGRATIHVVDVAKRKAMEAWAESVETAHGGVDVIINNAGVALLDTLEDVPYEEFHWVFDILFWGVVHGTRAFLPMVRARKGVIVNLGSIHSFIAAPNNGPYCSAKSAVRGFCDALREEVRDDGVQILLVMPGGIKTEIVRHSRVRKFINASASQEDVHRAHNAASLTSPEHAAQIILDAVEARNPRQLVGLDAVFYDGLTRLMPSMAHRLYAWGAKRMAVQRPTRT